MQIYPFPSEAAEERVGTIVNRGAEWEESRVRDVGKIMEEVRREGDRALIRYANRFDCPHLTQASLRVTEEEFEAAEKAVPEDFRKSLDRAVRQIEDFHRRQVEKSWITLDRPGVTLGQIYHAVEGAGVYVPGGQGGETPLISSVLMGGIPAKIAGVDRLVMATPSTREGTVNPHMLAAAKRVGIDAVYKVGSAWAIAALTYGTETVPRCDVIVGPGNIYVAIAKKLAAGTVGIDMIAGPSEVLVIADGGADPEYAAADLLSQAEHDAMASAMLITDAPDFAEAAAGAVARQLEALSRKETAKKSLEDFGAIFVVSDLNAAFRLANRIAPEHLELHVDSPFEYLGAVRNAGAVFLGPYTPEPMGDYIAGPNHVLPTAGTARFSSALSVDHFVKKTSVIHYTETAFRKEADDVIRLAETEGLEGHARAVRIRKEA